MEGEASIEETLLKPLRLMTALQVRVAVAGPDDAACQRSATWPELWQLHYLRVACTCFDKAGTAHTDVCWWFWVDSCIYAHGLSLYLEPSPYRRQC